jgi:acyl-CoA synthetase (AMP-forming)/AMP-acid ligase II
MANSPHHNGDEKSAQRQNQASDSLSLYAAMQPEKVALICEERALTFTQYNARANRAANALQKLGIRGGDRVALMIHNSLEWFEASASLSKLGAVRVPINYRLRSHEVAYIVNDSGATAIIVGAELVPVIEQARAEITTNPACIAVSDAVPPGWLRYEDLLAAASENPPAGDSTGGSTITYTSGTTGVPKGAYRPKGLPPTAIPPLVQAFELSPHDVHLLAGPSYHSAPEFFTGVYQALGSTIVIMPKFDAIEALRLIQQHRISTTFLPPILLQRLCDVPQEIAATYNTSSLRQIVVAGAPCPYSLKVKANERFGPVLWEFYGSTETAVVTILRPEDQLRKPGSCGTKGPGQIIRLLEEAGNEVPDGTPGELWASSEYLVEYYHKPEATAKNMREGFFTVGDVAYRDAEGFYYICDRKIDMVISGGVNIYPAEIEALLTAHPAIADVAVIGVPDERWGEAVKALVVLRPGMSATAEEVIAFCAARLADYKKPRSVDFVPELPRSPTGKLLKNTIREAYWNSSGRSI